MGQITLKDIIRHMFMHKKGESITMVNTHQIHGELGRGQ